MYTKNVHILSVVRKLFAVRSSSIIQSSIIQRKYCHFSIWIKYSQVPTTVVDNALQRAVAISLSIMSWNKRKEWKGMFEKQVDAPINGRTTMYRYGPPVRPNKHPNFNSYNEITQPLNIWLQSNMRLSTSYTSNISHHFANPVAYRSHCYTKGTITPMYSRWRPIRHLQNFKK